MRKRLNINEESKIQTYVSQKVRDSDLAHKFDHINCVVDLCKKIAKEEKCTMRILLPAAYFHDVVSRGKATRFENFREESAIMAAEFLKNLNFSNEEINQVKEVILTSGYEEDEKGLGPRTSEAKILHDADLLESIGARGIARVFSFCGFSHCQNLGGVEWNIDNPPRLPMNMDCPDPSPIYHFFSKLLWIKEKMKTSIGRKVAKSRHAYMTNFLKRYDCEYRNEK